MNKTTKKFLAITAIALIAMPLFTFYGCKKGEDDPFISLRSRDKRITGTWKLVKYDRTHTRTTTTSTSGSTVTQVDKWIDSFNGSTMSDAHYYTYTDQTGSNYFTDIEVHNYSLELTINKDNTSSYNETRSENTDCQSATPSCNPVLVGTPDSWTEKDDQGTWYWLDSKKNKISVFADSPSGQNGPSVGFDGNLRELKNKELILESSYNTTNTETSTGFNETITDVESAISTWEKQ